MTNFDETAENLLNDKARNRLDQLPLWSQALPLGTITDLEKRNVIIEHKERLSKYRKWRDWEAWVERDELDLEGDRILAEVKNFKSEFFFNT